MDLFKKSVIVGVSVTPEIGLEVAQVDFDSRTVLKYGVRPLEFDVNRREIADLDLFKEVLQDLFVELQIPKSVEVVLNLPTAYFKVNEYPAALDEAQLENAIEEELAEYYLFRENAPAMAASLLPISTMQFNKTSITAVSKNMLLEIAQIFNDLGVKLHAVDTSVNSVLNALMLTERVNATADTSWVLLLVDSFCCRIIPMIGNTYVDAFEERISIGEVLGEAENYGTIISAVTPLLKNLPSKYLCVVSKTSVISAEVLASKLTYSAPIIHQEANAYSHEALLPVAPSVDSNYAPSVSLDVIGAGIYREFEPYSSTRLNMYNSSLGEVYTMHQPPEFMFGGRKIVLSSANLIKMFIFLLIVVVVITAVVMGIYTKRISDQESEIERMTRDIADVDKQLAANKDISSSTFDEGDEIRMGLGHNKNIYSYFTIVGTEIPKKLWLTHLKFGDNTTIEGQADNLESVYAFFRSVKDYDVNSAIKLQKLGLASNSKLEILDDNAAFDTDSILTSMNADFYEFRISDEPEVAKESLDGKGISSSLGGGLPDLTEPIKE